MPEEVHRMSMSTALSTTYIRTIARLVWHPLDSMHNHVIEEWTRARGWFDAPTRLPHNCVTASRYQSSCTIYELSICF
jgi:hypothetical protein